MAWMHRTCDECGKKEGRAQVYGKEKTREYRFSKMSVLCPDCENARIEKQKEKFLEKNKESSRANESEGLCELEGSEKQVLWAESIRREKIDEFSRQLKRYFVPHGDTEEIEKAKAKIEFFSTEKNASKIIENRWMQ